MMKKKTKRKARVSITKAEVFRLLDFYRNSVYDDWREVHRDSGTKLGYASLYRILSYYTGSTSSRPCPNIILWVEAYKSAPTSIQDDPPFAVKEPTESTTIEFSTKPAKLRRPPKDFFPLYAERNSLWVSVGPTIIAHIKNTLSATSCLLSRIEGGK